MPKTKPTHQGSLTIDGRKWIGAAQASVDSILGGDTCKVSARGTGFYNKDRWTARVLFAKLAESIRYGNEFGDQMVSNAVSLANSTHVGNREIVIAAVPDRIPAWLARSSVGGRYHEAWHRVYSCTRDLSFAEVMEPLRQRWDLVDDWTGLVNAVLTWGNIIEDIKIERWGCKEYPGSQDKMEDLQDLILNMETEGRAASEHRGLPSNDDMAAVMGAYRDLGLGYQTEKQLDALKGYETRSPAGWSLVTEGPLKPLLDRAINMAREDDLGHWWLAMEIVAVLATLGKPQDQQPPKGDGRGDGPPGPPGPPSDDDSEGKGKGKAPKFPLFKVGDRAKAKRGAHRGKIVEVTFAGPPDEDGRQSLKFAVVED
jgi:hypothetical protein